MQTEASSSSSSNRENYTANVGLADITTRLPDETIHIPDIDVYAVTIDFGGAVVQGIVVDKETEEPVATVFVVARPSESSSGLSASSSMTRADGAFELELDPGVYELQTRADGYATGEHPIDVRGESSSSSIRIALEPARAIHGRVVDSQGRAMAGMLVIATESDAIAGAPTTGGRARTLGDGSFRVEQLARKTYNLLTGSELAGYGFRRNVRPGASEVDLALAPGGRVVVFARGEDGEPIDRVNITLTAIDGAPIRDFGTSTRSDGTATLSLPSGNLELMAVKDDLQGSTVVTVQPGADVPVEIRLVRRPR